MVGSTPVVAQMQPLEHVLFITSSGALVTVLSSVVEEDKTRIVEGVKKDSPVTLLKIVENII